MSDLFGPMFSGRLMRIVMSDDSWLGSILQTEAALARALETTGIAPAGSADAIEAACTRDRFDVRAIGEAARDGANPVIPLVEALRAAVARRARAWVHFGATSQDILDTAMMLRSRDALDFVVDEVETAAEACAALANEHRDSVMAARTLMQQALPTTFGLKAAGWLSALVDARAGLERVRTERLAVQLGGAAATLADYGDRALAMVETFAQTLQLPAPASPWHTNRTRIAEIASAVAIAANVAAKIATDIVLLMQTEVGEVREAAAPGRGRSSAMAHKRNPALSVAVIASARQAQAFASVLLGSVVQEHERAAGAWQAEWQALSGLFLSGSGATSGIAQILPGLEVDPERMRANMQIDASVGTGASDAIINRVLAAWDAAQVRP